MKKLLTLLMLIVVCSSNSYANGISLSSPGVKAPGMGGAFIGLADDYTSIFWNPAGQTNLDKAQISVWAMDVIPMATYELEGPFGPEGANAKVIDAETKTNHYLIPNLSAFVPLMSGDLSVGFGAYATSGLGAEWDGSELLFFSAMNPDAVFDWSNQIGAFNISPSVAYKINEQFSIGASLNVMYAMLDMARPMDLMDMSSGQPAMGSDNIMDAQYEESSTGLGIGFSFGALYKATDYLSIGVSYKSTTTIAMSGDATNSLFKNEALGQPEESEFERDLVLPMWIGGGIAVKPMEDLTLCFDLQWSQWSEAVDVLTTEYMDWKAPDGNGGVVNQKEDMHMEWEDAIQVRFGAQYDVNKDLALRCGFYLDPAPAPDKSLNIIFPSISYKTFTVGTSYDFGAVAMDFAFEYFLGEERDIPFGKYADANPGKHNMDIMAIAIGFTYTFDK